MISSFHGILVITEGNVARSTLILQRKIPQKVSANKSKVSLAPATKMDAGNLAICRDIKSRNVNLGKMIVDFINSMDSRYLPSINNR